MAISGKEIAFIILLASSGVWGKEFFYTSHLEISKASGRRSEEIDSMRLLFDQFWDILTKNKINTVEEENGMKLLKSLWSYIDDESRYDFEFLDQNIDYFFNNIYRSELALDFYNYDPTHILKQVKCPVLALNGDKDIQVVSYINLPAIERALKSGICENYQVLELKDHNHLFQECETGKISEYIKINTTISDTTLYIIGGWINSLK